MKRQAFASFVAGVLLLLAAPGSIRAQDPDVPWWIIAGGGGTATGGQVMLEDTIGEPVIGGSSGSSFELDAGYRQKLYGPAAIADLRPLIIVDGGQRKLGLEWASVNLDTVGHTITGVRYSIYRVQDNPFFTPDAASIDDRINPTYTDNDTAVLTNPAHSTYYVVRAVSGGLLAGPSNRVGAFVFGLTPGG